MRVLHSVVSLLEVEYWLRLSIQRESRVMVLGYSFVGMLDIFVLYLVLGMVLGVRRVVGLCRSIGCMLRRFVLR